MFRRHGHTSFSKGLLVITALIAVGGLPVRLGLATEQKVVLRLGKLPRKDTVHPMSVGRRRVFEAFCRAYPHIEVREVSPLEVEGPAKGSQEFLAIVGGVAPDVFLIDGRQIGDYHAQGFLYPLNESLEQYRQETGRNFIGIGTPAAVWEPTIIEGKCYAVPWVGGSMVLVARRDLFARAGLPLRGPEDWDELYHFARCLTYDPAKEPDSRPGELAVYGLHLPSRGPGAPAHATKQLIFSAGGEIVRSYLPDSKGNLIPVPPSLVSYRKFGIEVNDPDRYYPKLAALRQKLRQQGIDPHYRSGELKWRLVTNEPAGIDVLEFYRRFIHSKWIRCRDENGKHEFDL